MNFRAFIDESSASRGDGEQEYLLCAAIVPADECNAAREALRPLLLPGQIKVHWSDESPSRRRKITTHIVNLGPMNVLVAHLDAKLKKVERYRRKCLETLYYELIGMHVFDAVLGATNAAHLGKTLYYDALQSTLMLETRTPGSRHP